MAIANSGMSMAIPRHSHCHDVMTMTRRPNKIKFPTIGRILRGFLMLPGKEEPRTSARTLLPKKKDSLPRAALVFSYGERVRLVCALVVMLGPDRPFFW